MKMTSSSEHWTSNRMKPFQNKHEIPLVKSPVTKRDKTPRSVPSNQPLPLESHLSVYFRYHAIESLNNNQLQQRWYDSLKHQMYYILIHTSTELHFNSSTERLCLFFWVCRTRAHTYPLFRRREERQKTSLKASGRISNNGLHVGDSETLPYGLLLASGICGLM